MNTKKPLAIFVLFIFISLSALHAQGKYAGTMKKLIGKKYTGPRNIALIKGWTFREGSVITPMDDPELMIVDVYQKGTTWMVFFSIKEDTADINYTIMDVIEVKNVLKGWEIRTGTCREYKRENVEIVALVKGEVNVEFLKQVKQAWRFNRDKKRAEVISAKVVDCISEGGD